MRLVFEQVARITPDSIPLTAFSILLSRLKGDLVAQTSAAVAVDLLRPGERCWWRNPARTTPSKKTLVG